MVLSAAVLKESVRVKRSGSRREVSGDFCPSISFSVSEPEKEEGEEKGTDGNREKGNERGFSIERIEKQRNYTFVMVHDGKNQHGLFSIFRNKIHPADSNKKSKKNQGYHVNFEVLSHQYNKNTFVSLYQGCQT